MNKKILLILAIGFVWMLAFAETFSPLLYIGDYSPVVDNKIIYYKLDKGLNFRKAAPYMVTDFGTKTTEKVDYQNQNVKLTAQIGEIQLYPAVVLSFDEYFNNLSSAIYHVEMRKTVLDMFSISNRSSTAGIIPEITIDLPNIAIPKSVRKFLGNKAGKLSLDGSQKLTFTGTSTKSQNHLVGENMKGSNFDVVMRQDLNLSLKGTIGDKITVSLTHNSNQDEQLFNPNNINVQYKGDEDEIVQSVEMGNITLALSGSRYISYSASSQGLFGVKSKMKIGNLELTTILSKEEGQKNKKTFTGSTQADSVDISSRSFVNRKMYYIAKPKELYSLYQAGDLINTDPSIQDTTHVPPGWVDNAIKVYRGALVANTDLLPKAQSLFVYMDDANSNNDNNALEGDPVTNSQGVTYTPMYDELLPGVDYDVDYAYNQGIIILYKTIESNFTIAVKYVQANEVAVPATFPNTDKLHVRVLRSKNQENEPTNPNNTWDYEVRNMYDLGQSNVQAEGFRLDIFTIQSNMKRDYNVPDSIVTNGLVRYNDYLHMDTNGDNFVGDGDLSLDLAKGYIRIPFLRPFEPLGDLIYNKEPEYLLLDQSHMLINYKGKVARERIALNQFGILKGSVHVKVNGEQLRENIDYVMDYDLGEVTFLTPKGKNPQDKVEIDYEFKSGFAVEKKSLMGVRADYIISDNTKIGGTFIYRTESVTDKHPKIGNENLRLILADVDGQFAVQPAFVTRMIDALPMIKTNADSKILLSGEIAMSLPYLYGDPNTKKQEAYIDDMEGILDVFPLGVMRSTWVPGSKPSQINLAKAKTIWYNPDDVYAKDVYNDSTLTEKEKKDKVTVMAVKMSPNPLGMPGSNITYWGGLMKYIGNQIDLSQKKYIEILVKVDPLSTDEPGPVVMHVDLGNISEDFYTDFGEQNGKPNTEDGSNGGPKDGVLDSREDVGLDGKPNGTFGADPNDIASSDQEASTGDYPHINGTEHNGILDTEDLNGNGALDVLDQYFEYTISLSNPALYPPINTNQNGWKLYRIPMHDPNFMRVVTNSTTTNPSLQKISYARIWFEVEKTTRVKFANLDIVGNKWEDKGLRNPDETVVPVSTIEMYQEEMLVGIIDNQNNNHYRSPAGTFETVDSKAALEQSLIIDYKNLQPTHFGLVKQIFRESFNLLSYNNLKFLLYPEKAQNADQNPDSINIIMRMGADSTHYYEIRYKTKVERYYTPTMEQSKWTTLEFPFSKLSMLRSDSSHVKITQPYLGNIQLTRGEIQEDNYTFAFVGASNQYPSLNNIKEISLGVEALGSQSQPYTGTIYFDDIRVSDPIVGAGYAGRASISTTFADFSTLDVEIIKQSPYFSTTSQRSGSLSGSFEETTSLNISNNYSLHKFMPDSWSLSIPLSLKYAYQMGIPKFRAYSDQLNIATETQERDERHQTSYSADLGFSQLKAPKNAILAYTIKNTAVSGNITYTKRLDPTTADTTLSYREVYNYRLDIPKEKFALKFSKDYALYFLPKTFNNAFTYFASFPKSYLKNTVNPNQWDPRDQTRDTRQLTTDNSLGYDILTDLTTTYRLTTKRDFMIRQMRKSINIGIESEHLQDVNLDYTPRYVDNLLTFSTNVNSKYSETFRQNNASNLNNLTVENFKRDGNTNRAIRSNMTIKNSDLLSSWARIVISHQEQKKLNKSTVSESAINTVTTIDQYPEVKPAGWNPYQIPSVKPIENSNRQTKRGTEKTSKDQPQENKVTDSEESDQKSIEDRKKQKEMLTYQTEEEKNKAEQEGKGNQNDNRMKPKDQVSSENPQADFLSAGSFLSYLSKIKNLATTYQNGYTTSFQYLDNRPNFWYQLGLPHTLADSLLNSRNYDNSYGLSSGIAFTSNLDSDIKYTMSIQKSYANSSQTSTTVVFPDVTLTLSEFQKYLHAQKILTSSRLTSNYSLSNKESDRPEKTIRTVSMQPFLAWTANWVNNMTTNLAYNLSQSEDITIQSSSSKVRNTTNSQSVSGNLSYAFTAEKGIHIPFSKKKIQFKNEMTSSIGLSWQKDYNVNYGRETVVNLSTQKISITPGATYQFHRNIKGGLTSSYELQKNLKKNESLRTFSISIWMEIQF